MEGKKRYVAIILFLLICLMLFTFATTGDDNLEGKDESGKIQEITNKDSESKDKDTDKNKTESKEDKNSSNGSNPNGSSNNSSSNAEDDENLEGTGNTDNSAYDKALEAVEKLESLLTDEQAEIAKELVDQITNNPGYQELVDRIADAEDAIDATELVEALEKMVEEAAKRTDIEDATDFRDDEVMDAINEIDGEQLEEVKEDLLNRIEELSKILDDNSKPTYEGIENGTATKEDVSITVTDENEVTTIVTKDGEEIDFEETFEEEGEYVLTFTDEAFNEETLTFTIDKTKPAFEGLPSREAHIDDYEIDVTDATDVTITYKKDHGAEQNAEEGTKITEEGTYEIIAVDEAGNKSTTWVIIDKTLPTIEGITGALVNSCQNITVFDRYLTEVDINGVKYTRADFTHNTKNENHKFEAEICAEGTYTITGKDKSGKSVTETFTIDKSEAKVRSVDFYVSGLTQVDKTFYTPRGKQIVVNIKTYEQLKEIPTFTLHNNGKDYVLTDVLDRGENAPGVWLYQASYVIGEEMTDGDITFTISNIVDLAGNVKTTNVTEATNGRKVVLDSTAPTYKFYKEGSSLPKDEIQPVEIKGKLYFTENVRVVFEDETYFTQYIHNDFLNNEDKTTIKSWTREAKVDGEHTMKVTDSVGNVTEISFIIDTTAPTYKFYKEGSSLPKDEIQPVEKDGVLYFNQNVRVVFEENIYFTQYIHNDFVNNEDKITIKSWTREAKTDGKHTMKVTDVVGHTTEVSFIVDTTAPTITVKDESVGKDGVYSKLSLKLYDANKVDYVLINGVKHDKTPNEWSDANYQNIKNDLVEGKNTIVLYDMAGNSTTLEVTMDYTAPTLSIKDESVGKDGVYSKLSLKLYDANKVDYVLVNGVKHDVGDAVWSDANYQNIKNSLKEGKNEIVLYDIAGNSSKLEVTMDYTAPTLTIKDDSVGKDGVYSKVNFKLHDANKVDYVLVNGVKHDVGDAVWSDANFGMIKGSLKEGKNEVVLYDIAGNSTTLEVFMDFTAPTITVKDESVGKDGVYSKLSLKLYDANKVDYVLINGVKHDVGDAVWSDANFQNIKNSLKEGKNEIVLYDIAGNSSKLEVTMDYTKPTITAQYRTDLADKRTDVIGSDKHYIEFTIYKNGKYEYSVKPDPKTNKKRFSIDHRGDGIYEVVVTDQAGLSNSVMVTIDHTAPVVTPSYTNKTVEADKNATFADFPTFETEDLTKVTEKLVSGEVNMGVAGDYVLTYEFTDEFGNKSTKEVTVTVVDTTAPVVTPSYTETQLKEDSVKEFTDVPTFEVEDNASTEVKQELISGSVDPSKVGTYELIYRFTDASGNYTDVTITVEVVDLTAPTISGLVDGGFYNTKETEAIPTVYDKNGALLFVKTTIGDTEVISPWISGKEITQIGTYQVYAVDKFGNKSEEITINIDPLAPKILVLDRIENISGAILPIKPVILERYVDKITVTLDGKEIDFNEGDQLTKDGKYVMTVTDKAGNSTTVEFTMDSIAPTMMVSPLTLGVVDELDLNDSISGDFIITEESEFQLMKVTKYITVLDKSIPIYEYTEMPEDKIIDEEGEYILIAYDKAYNVTAAKFIVDRTAPVINGVEDGKTYTSAVTITVDEANPAPLIGTILSKKSVLGIYVPTTFPENGVISESGEYSIKATDIAGNESATIKFTVDTIAPTISVDIKEETLQTTELVNIVATVTDNISATKKLSPNVTKIVDGVETDLGVQDTIDASVSGVTYRLEYATTDDAGNPATKTIETTIVNITYEVRFNEESYTSTYNGTTQEVPADATFYMIKDGVESVVENVEITYSSSAPLLNAGKYTITATANGYTSEPVEFEMKKAAIVVDFTNLPTAITVGTTKDGLFAKTNISGSYETVSIVDYKLYQTGLDSESGEINTVEKTTYCAGYELKGKCIGLTLPYSYTYAVYIKEEYEQNYEIKDAINIDLTNIGIDLRVSGALKSYLKAE